MRRKGFYWVRGLCGGAAFFAGLLWLETASLPTTPSSFSRQALADRLVSAYRNEENETVAGSIVQNIKNQASRLGFVSKKVINFRGSPLYLAIDPKHPGVEWSNEEWTQRIRKALQVEFGEFVHPLQALARRHPAINPFVILLVDHYPYLAEHRMGEGLLIVGSWIYQAPAAVARVLEQAAFSREVGFPKTSPRSPEGVRDPGRRSRDIDNLLQLTKEEERGPLQEFISTISLRNPIHLSKSPSSDVLTENQLPPEFYFVDSLLEELLRTPFEATAPLSTPTLGRTATASFILTVGRYFRRDLSLDRSMESMLRQVSLSPLPTSRFHGLVGYGLDDNGNANYTRPLSSAIFFEYERRIYVRVRFRNQEIRQEMAFRTDGPPAGTLSLEAISSFREFCDDLLHPQSTGEAMGLAHFIGRQQHPRKGGVFTLGGRDILFVLPREHGEGRLGDTLHAYTIRRPTAPDRWMLIVASSLESAIQSGKFIFLRSPNIPEDVLQIINNCAELENLVASPGVKEKRFILTQVSLFKQFLTKLDKPWILRKVDPSEKLGLASRINFYVKLPSSIVLLRRFTQVEEKQGPENDFLVLVRQTSLPQLLREEIDQDGTGIRVLTPKQVNGLRQAAIFEATTYGQSPDEIKIVLPQSRHAFILKTFTSKSSRIHLYFNLSLILHSLAALPEDPFQLKPTIFLNDLEPARKGPLNYHIIRWKTEKQSPWFFRDEFEENEAFNAYVHAHALENTYEDYWTPDMHSRKRGFFTPAPAILSAG